MKAWDEFLEKLKPKLGEKTVSKWLGSLEVERFDARNIYLQSKDPLQISWFEEHIRPLVKGGLFNNNARSIQVHLTLKNDLPQKSGSANTPSTESKPTFSIQSDPLDSEMSFENFETLPETLVAYELFKDPKTLEFNPIFLYGPKSSGKTHLMMAAANLMRASGKKVFYVKAETFTSHVVQAIRLGLMQQFRSAYRNIDALFVDGIDFLAKKDASQEEFFHTFNNLHTAGKKIFLSSQLHPSKLKDIEPRLISRFEWGLSLKLMPADSLKILEKKAHLWKIHLSPDVLKFLASKFPQDPIFGLQALSLRSGGMTSLTVEKSEKILADLLQSKAQKELKFEDIIERVANHFKIKPDDILGKSQAREHAYPRQVAMYFIRDKLKIPFQKMGELFARDHSTVMSSIKQIQKSYEDKTSNVFIDIETLLKSF